MNLYAIQPDHSPDSPVFMLANTHEKALERAVFVAAHDMIDGNGSPTASVYLIAADVPAIGRARAGALLRDPRWWGPEGREELSRALAEWEQFKAEYGVEDEP